MTRECARAQMRQGRTCRLKREKDGRGWCFSKGLWLSDTALGVFIKNFHLCDLKNLVRGCSGSSGYI